MSFVNATLVLSIGETVEEVTDSGFLGTTPTLSCSTLGEDALVQVGLKFRSCILKTLQMEKTFMNEYFHTDLPGRYSSYQSG